jgi:hypothetical protein
MSVNKARLRAELFKYAAKGEFPTYAEMRNHLVPKIKTGWRKEWSVDLDQIAMEERSHGYPDITFILRHSGKNGLPSRVDFRPIKKLPDKDQRKSLINGTDKIIRLYCPKGTPNIYRNIKI